MFETMHVLTFFNPYKNYYFTINLYIFRCNVCLWRKRSRIINYMYEVFLHCLQVVFIDSNYLFIIIYTDKNIPARTI